METEMTEEQRARRLELARKAFHDFKAQCFWWVRDDLEINEAALPTIIEGLRLHGGHQGYRIVVELCR